MIAASPDRHSTQARLNESTLSAGSSYLAAIDEDIAAVVKRLGQPPLWLRNPGFSTLVHIILEQQVSLASARAAYERLLARTTVLTPQAFLELDDDELKRIGFSRQKSGYVCQLARQIAAGEVDLASIQTMDDATARSNLMRVKGIGPWSAGIYLLMALGRQDIWPSGDLALATAVQQVKRLPTRPDYTELDALSAVWKPWRAVAARIFWNHYLNRER
ncbi:MAG: DNA-3-methyladenine glycosylase 2 family protein [Chloroflexi bacterium]|nr:DNA-3-methyladenine glycosylase 2 family protein [Chloroflexota bacterium]